ncbi:MAG: tetratricopeptide repeat protein [Anaerolineae bacterium]
MGTTPTGDALTPEQTANVHRAQQLVDAVLLNVGDASTDAAQAAQLIRADLLAAQGLLSEATDAYQAALLQDPDNATAIEGLARLLLAAGEADQAIARYQAAADAAETDEGRNRWLMTIAATYRSLGRLDEAEQIYRGMMEADPTNSAAHQALGDLYPGGQPAGRGHRSVSPGRGGRAWRCGSGLSAGPGAVAGGPGGGGGADCHLPAGGQPIGLAILSAGRPRGPGAGRSRRQPGQPAPGAKSGAHQQRGPDADRRHLPELCPARRCRLRLQRSQRAAAEQRLGPGGPEPRLHRPGPRGRRRGQPAPRPGRGPHPSGCPGCSGPALAAAPAGRPRPFHCWRRP